MYSTLSAPQKQDSLAWLLDRWVNETPQVESCILLTADGLIRERSSSRSIHPDTADRMAAAGSGFMALSRSLERGQARQVVVELDEAYLLVAPAAAGTRLMVLATTDADVTLVGDRMAWLVKQVGPHIGAAPRAHRGTDVRSAV